MLSKDDKKRIAEEERYRDEVRGNIKPGEPLDDDKAKPATNSIKEYASIAVWGVILLAVIGRCAIF